MIDTDYSIQLMVQAGVEEPQARSIVRAIVDAQTELVSQRDLKEGLSDLKADLKNELAGIKYTMSLDQKLASLKFSGLYALLFAISAGVLKLVFYK